MLHLGSSMIATPMQERIEFMLKLYQSTSPSYILMASIDAARSIMERQGRELFDQLNRNIALLSARISHLRNIKRLDDTQLGKFAIAALDPTKIVLNAKIGGIKLAQELETVHHIVVEMADIHNVVLIASVADDSGFFDKLYAALESIDQKATTEHQQLEMIVAPEYTYACNMRTAFYSKKEKLKLEDSIGRVSTEMVVPYPPGIPVILPGELMTAQMLEYLIKIKAAGIQISGMEDLNAETIKVIDG
jgi:arginine/lysine/ornithine decarboxylase